MRRHRDNQPLHDPAPAPQRLTILSERHGDAHVLQPVGDLDLDTVDDFEEELKRIEATDAPVIRMDLSRVDFIDVDGVKLILNAANRCRGRAGRLTLVRGSDPVHRAFQTIGLKSHLPFAD